MPRVWKSRIRRAASRAAPPPERARLMPSDGMPSVRRMGGFRRAFLGYRQADVDAAIADRDVRIERHESALADLGGRIEETEGELLCLSRMVLDRERESALLRDQLRAAEARHERSLESLQIVARRLDDIQAQARGQATRIRMKALRDAVEVSERAQDLTQRMDFAGHGGADLDAPAADGLQEGRVQVEVGPLSDFSQLLSFQEAAEGLREVAGVRLERFSEGCATLSLDLHEPTDLAAALMGAAALPLRTRSASAATVTFDVVAAAPGKSRAA